MTNYNAIKFIIILLFFVFALCNHKKAHSQTDSFLLCLAMFFTVVSDFFMLIVGNNLFGLVTFCVVQLIYHVRYAGFRLKTLGFAVGLFFVTGLFDMEALYHFATLYAFLFILNLFAVWRAFSSKKYPFPNNCLCVAGMILFALCDINVMLKNLPIPSQFESVVFFLVWFFYIPSQYLLSMSARTFRVY